MGDCYAQGGKRQSDHDAEQGELNRVKRQSIRDDDKGIFAIPSGWAKRGDRAAQTATSGLKPKDLCMMPARLAMALQADGWYLRSEIVWHKPNPMPESCTDRPTKAHEMIYLLAKNGGNRLIWRARDTGEWSYSPDLSEAIKPKGYHDAPAAWDLGDGGHTKVNGNYKHPRQVDPQDELIPRWKGFDYFYDAEAIRERSTEREAFGNSNGKTELNGDRRDGGRRDLTITEFRNKRSVWTVATQPFSGAHF